MRINKSLSASLLAAAVCSLAPMTASAWSPKLEVSDTTWVQLGYLHQAWFEAVDDGTAAGDDWSSDFFTRRSRVMLLGQATDKVFFFLNYDAASGSSAEYRQDPVLTDAIIDYRISPAFNVSVGRILVPFSFDNQTSAVSLLGIDYPTRALVGLPTNSSGAFWRDDGIEVRGLLGDGLIDYRVGYFRGDRDTTRNPDEDGRFTGMVTINFGAAQGGWFFNGNSLGALDVLSIGVGYDSMGRSGSYSDGTVTRDYDDHEAYSVFAAMEKKLFGGTVAAQAAYYDWEGVGNPGGAFYNGGNTSALTVGYLMGNGRWQPVVRWQNQDPDDGDSLDTVGIGLSYYISGHRANIKAEYSMDDQRNSDGDEVDAFRVSAQVFF
jgi:hypothetical protein